MLLNNYLKIVKSNKGSLTVEASLVFPIVMLAIAMVIFITFLMYQDTYTETSVNLVVERSVPVRENLSVEIATGRISAANLEKSLFFMPLSEDKKKEIDTYLREKLNVFNILTPQSREIIITSDNNLIYQTLEIEVTENYSLPAGRIFGLIGLNEGISRTAQAQVTIIEPEEMVRNVDLIMQILNLE